MLALAPTVMAAVPEIAPNSIAERVQSCTACHGKEGRATNQGYFPRIAGKPAGYLFNQLVNFRDGRRAFAPMTHLLKNLPDAYLAEMAQYFAALDLPYPAPQPEPANTAALALGEALVRRGDAARRIPACNDCHGSAMTGVQPAVPGLLGLPRDYLIGQLGAWQNRQRRAAAPDCMAQITAQLRAEDISAVAAWLAAQPVPPDAKAAPALPPDAKAAMPLACGSSVPPSKAKP